MKVSACQENEKTGNCEEGEEIKQSTDFKEAVCCPSAIVLTTISTQPKRGREPHHHVETTVDWPRKLFFRSIYRRSQVLC